MTQLTRIKQIEGLTAALASKVETASNVGTANQGIFKQKVGTNLEFFKLNNSTSSVVAGAPVSDIIPFDLEIKNISTEITTTQGTDRLALMDDSDGSDGTGFITLTNFGNSVSVPVKFGDYITDTSEDADHILFFDNDDSDNPNIETKSSFLSEHARLNDPDFTGTPTAPTAAAGTDNTELATTAFVKTAVDNNAAGLDVKNSVRVATDGDDLDVETGETWTASGSGVGKTLTSDTNSTTSIDGVTLADGDRVLVKDQSTAIDNGIYTASNTGAGSATVLTRAIDFDQDSEVTAGAFTFIEEGTVNNDRGWVLSTDDNIIVDTTALTFTQFTGAGSFTAGAGLVQTLNVLDVVGTADRITVNPDSVDIAATYAGQATIIILGTVGTGTWEATTIAVAFGGTGLTAIAANSILHSTGAANVYTPTALGASQILGRKSAGDIVAFTQADIREVAQVRQVTDNGTLTNGSMILGTLTQTPLAVADVVIFINGEKIKQTDDYTISGVTVTATNNLNIAYGGSAADGLGFENDDEFEAIYEF